MQTPTNDAMRALRFRLERCGFPAVPTDQKDLIPLFLLEEELDGKDSAAVISLLLTKVNGATEALSAEIRKKAEEMRSEESEFTSLLHRSVAVLSEIPEIQGNLPRFATAWGLERSEEWTRIAKEIASVVLTVERKLSRLDALPLSEVSPIGIYAKYPLWHFKAAIALHGIEDSTLHERLSEVTALQRELKRFDKIARERRDLEIHVHSVTRTFRTALLSKICFSQPNEPFIPKAETTKELLLLIQNHQAKLQDALRAYPSLKGECSQ